MKPGLQYLPVVLLDLNNDESDVIEKENHRIPGDDSDIIRVWFVLIVSI